MAIAIDIKFNINKKKNVYSTKDHFFSSFVVSAGAMTEA